MSREEKLNKKLYYKDGGKFRCLQTNEVLFEYAGADLARTWMRYNVHN